MTTPDPDAAPSAGASDDHDAAMTAELAGAAPEPGPDPAPPVRLRLDIAYDGGGFSGWSRQPGLRTVQGELESALGTVLGRHGPVASLVVAGRTDAGVHALGQVAHLDLTAAQKASLTRPHRGPARGRRLDGPATLAKRLNGIAGPNADIQVRRVTPAPEGFDARFSAVWRRYEYRIADADAPRNPLARASTLWHPARLDAGRMRDAAHALLGLHDWSAYCKARDIGTNIRTLQEFDWRRDAEGVLVAAVRADAFCHSMVRALVGASIAVGEGRLDGAELVRIRDGAERTDRFATVPARGLTLLEVGYPDDAELAARAVQTRAIRPRLTASEPIE